MKRHDGLTTQTTQFMRESERLAKIVEAKAQADANLHRCVDAQHREKAQFQKEMCELMLEQRIKHAYEKQIAQLECIEARLKVLRARSFLID
ncbi:hypothetical protein C2S53_013569 [Perilla frutescens var. hirtella]|uniref:Uncharacterized protein n=1 Tax=Perilla frutescens var. hirtella TaxID=608512 RepID=A0AAD4IYE4_PERFH|nr:hypothetical protein C2S53_013569 [Perilla frutescens var. hirtella]